ncbi:MAG TPA: hypothetical protein VKQ52_10140, partial [Puia sp.]|nr:hypothetical protein [Puia sp.]
MYKLLIPLTLALAARTATAQTSTPQIPRVRVTTALTPDSLIAQLKMINAAVAGPSPAAGKHLLLSNRALNVFLSEAAGYYLSTPNDLTLYKNSVIANSAEGTFALYHNMREPAGIDSSLRRFLSVGTQANVADAFNASSSGRPYNNQFGFLLKQTWIAKPRVTATPGEIRAMDALRAGILHSLEGDIRRKAAAGEAALNAIDTARDIPGQDLASAKDIARQKFNADLQLETTFEFAYRQAEALARSFGYRVVAFNWTSISLYLPLVTENFQVAASPGAVLSSRHAYPVHFNLTHTRLWEGGTFGRIFLTLAGDCSLNNSRDGYILTKSGNNYIGDYNSFITPAVKGQLIYIPKDSHIGI